MVINPLDIISLYKLTNENLEDNTLGDIQASELREVVFRLIDTLQANALSKVIGFSDDPVLMPEHGDTYIVGTNPSGVWATKSQQLAIYDLTTTSWNYLEPSPEMGVLLMGLPGTRYIYNGVFPGGAWNVADQQGQVFLNQSNVFTGILNTFRDILVKGKATLRATGAAVQPLLVLEDVNSLPILTFYSDGTTSPSLIPDLSVYQTKTDNGLQTVSKDIVTSINEVNSKASGKSRSLVFDTKAQLDNWVAGTYTRPDNITPSDCLIGDNLYIIDTGTPDYWASQITPTFTYNILESESSFSPTNTIYVDSEAPIGGDGTTDRPYKDPVEVTEVVVPFTGNLSINSATIAAISDTSQLNIGDIVNTLAISTAVAWESRIVSKTANSITLDKVCTANAANVDLRAITPKKVICTGNFTITANLERMNVVEWDWSNSNVQWGNLTMINLTSVRIANLRILDGTHNGTHINSKHLGGSVNQSPSHCLYYYTNKTESITTGILIGQANNYQFGNVYINSKHGIIASAGTAISIFIESAEILGYKYGLLGGVICYSNQNKYCLVDGVVTTPSAVNAIYNGSNSLFMEVNGFVNGSIQTVNYSALYLNAKQTGTNLIIATADKCIINGDTIITTGTFSYRGNIVHNGFASGTYNCTSGGGSVKFMNLNGAISIVGGLENEATMNTTSGFSYTNGNITLTSNAKLTVHNTAYISEYNYQQLSIASGCKLINKGYLRGRFSVDMAGTFINDGEFILIDQNVNGITGRFINNPCGTIEFQASGGRFTDTNYSPRLYNKNGGYIKLSGRIDASLVSTFEVFKKDATSTMIFKNLSIKCNGGLNILKCTTNTAGSKDIVIDDLTTNLNSPTYSILNAFDGTSFAPNATLLNELKESNTYTWI